MTLQEFNELLQLQMYDMVARKKLYFFCLQLINHRLSYRGVFDDAESYAHSILCKLIKNLPSKVSSIYGYICRCVDYYLSTKKKKTGRTVQLIENCAYEQYFERLENYDLFQTLVKCLDDKLNAKIIYMHFVEGAKEYEIAQALGSKLSYDAIRQRICRSKKILKEKFEYFVTKSDAEQSL